MQNAPAISLDFETFNLLDLKQVGAELYAASYSLEVTVIAWAIENGPVKSVTNPRVLPAEIASHLAQGGRLRAWNAAFEWAILFNHYKLQVPWENVDCTMQRALYAGLPASLEKAGMALGLAPGMLKDNVGHRLMLQMTRPRLGGGKWHKDDPGKLARLELYCQQDVIAEREIASRLAYLPETERRVSLLDHQTNQRGIALDIPLIQSLTDLAREETSHLNQACATLTSGAVTSPGTQTAKLTAWLQAKGVPVSDGLDKAAVADLLAGVAAYAGDIKQVLELRQEVAKSSTRKLVAMTRCAGSDHRVRGQLMYYGASRTGRFSGKLIQPQNMPRPTFTKPNLKSAITAIKQGASRDTIDELFGSPLDVVASALRSCLVPGPGKLFVSYDFKQIEARVLVWLARALDTLKAFADGEDIYVREQKKIGLASRLAGKVVVLACGFGMGAPRFLETAATYGLIITLAQAIQIVSDWREANPEIVDLWYAFERAARKALFRPGVAFPVAGGKVTFQARGASFMEPATLAMTLPSGRQLFYRNIRTVPDPSRPGKGGDLTYSGIDQTTRQWVDDIRTWGGKLVENAVQATARDVLTDAALRVDAAGFGELVLSVHDELIWEVPTSLAAERAKAILAWVEKSPAFAPDLPIGAEGGVKASYGV